MFDVILKNKNTYLGGRKCEEYTVFYKDYKIGEINGESHCIDFEEGKSIFSKEQFEYVGYIYSPDDTSNIFRSSKYSTLVGARIALEKEFNKKGLLVSDYMNKSKKAPVESLTAFDYNGDFYPTPEKLAGLMIAGVNLNAIVFIRT